MYREAGELDRAVQHHAAIEILDLPSAKLDRAEVINYSNLKSRSRTRHCRVPTENNLGLLQ